MKMKSVWKRLSILLVVALCLELVPQMNTQVNAALLSSEAETDELFSEPASKALIAEPDTATLFKDDAESLIGSEELLNSPDRTDFENIVITKKCAPDNPYSIAISDSLHPGSHISANMIPTVEGYVDMFEGVIVYNPDDGCITFTVKSADSAMTVNRTASIKLEVCDDSDNVAYYVVINVERVIKQQQVIVFVDENNNPILSINKTTNDAAFTMLVSSNNPSPTLVFSIDNPSVATIDSRSGRVRIIGQGSALISARAEEDDGYLENESSDSVQLNVRYEPAQDPTPTWSMESVDWSATYADTAETASALFHLKKNTTASDNSVTVSASQITIEKETNTEKTFKATLTYENQTFTDTKTVKKTWEKESVDWTASFSDTAATARAVFNLKSNALSNNTISLSASNIILLSENEVSKTFKATLTYEGYNFEDEYTVYSHTEHKWTVSFNWVNVSSNTATTLVTAEATCINGGEREALAVTVINKENGGRIEYTATATDPSGKKWKSKKSIYKDGTIAPDGKEIGKGILIVGLEDEYDYTGKQIKPAFQVIDSARDDAVLALNVDYTVKYGANKDPGEKAGNIEVKGKGNYTGSATSATFAIVNRRAELSEEEQSGLFNLKGASVRISEKFTYTGEPQYPKSFELKLKGGSWTKYDTEDGRIYKAGDNELKAVVTFSNNVNKGTATMLIEGATDDKGKITAVKKNFSIKAADLKDAKFAENMEGTYRVKGAKPDKLTVTWQANEDSKELTLVEGQDFKVKYSDNKEAGTGKIVITGKGNFTKKAEGGTFKINPMIVEAKDVSVVVSDKTAANKVKVTILDADGNALNQNKQLYVTVTGEDGIDLGKNKVKSGDKIYVNVKSKDTKNVTIDEKGIDVSVIVGAKLSKAKVAVNNYTKTYTGSPVTLDEDAFKTIKVTMNGMELKYGKDFEIAGYKNNNKKGTMTVTIRGIENTEEGSTPVSGTKTFKVKINPKPVSGD